jgi:hypothetical protein
MVGRLQVDGHQLKQHRLRAGAFALTRRPKKRTPRMNDEFLTKNATDLSAAI